MGLLTVRIHGFRVDGTSEVLLVAGGQLEIDRHQNEDVTFDVRFRAYRDVLYACYGFFSEPSDLAVNDLKIVIEELDDDQKGNDPLEEDVASSVLASLAIGASASQSSALVHAGPATLDVPVIQDCTLPQLRSRKFLAEGGRGLTGSDALQKWSEIACRQALIAYGASHQAVHGLMIGGSNPFVSAFCAERGMVLRQSDWSIGDDFEELRQNGHVDFLISWLDFAAIESAGERYRVLVSLLSRLMIGGLCVICFRYVPDSVTPSSSMASASKELTRNEIGQWLMRLIGAGFSTAPIAFGSTAELVRDDAGRTAIVLVLRRL